MFLNHLATFGYAAASIATPSSLANSVASAAEGEKPATYAWVSSVALRAARGEVGAPAPPAAFAAAGAGEGAGAAGFATAGFASFGVASLAALGSLGAGAALGALAAGATAAAAGFGSAAALGAAAFDSAALGAAGFGSAALGAAADKKRADRHFTALLKDIGEHLRKVHTQPMSKKCTTDGGTRECK